MKKNIFPLLLLLLSAVACGQKKIDTVTLSNGKTIVVYDNKTWAYVEGPVKTPQKSNPGTTGTYKEPDPSDNHNYPPKKNNKNVYSSVCGARTKKGGACQRKVSGGGRCWQH